MKSYKIYYQVIQEAPEESIEIEAETERKARTILRERVGGDTVRINGIEEVYPIQDR